MTTLIKLSASELKPLNQPSEDILARLLASRLSNSTTRTYATGIKHFASYLLGYPVNKGDKYRIQESEVKQAISTFLALEKKQALSYLAEYQVTLLKAGYTPNSINAKIAAVKAIVNYAFKLEHIAYTLNDVKALPPENYRDTSGVGIADIKSMVSSIDTRTPNGKRDYAIMRLLWDIGLRRAEVSSLDVTDYDPALKTLRIKGKGRLSKEVVALPETTANALNNWLNARPNIEGGSPALFIALDWRSYGERTSTKHIYQLVKRVGEEVTAKPMSPHKIRHSAITALLDQTDGNVRMAQKFSRHKSLEILIKYDDNRQALQAEATNLLAGLV